MNYTPNDLKGLSFKKAVLGGYDEVAVNEALEKIIEDYNSYVHENIELKDKISALYEAIQHYKNLEESLQNTLVIAQQTSDEVKKNAYQKAENVVKEAEMRAHKYIEDANKDVLRLRFEYEEMKKRMAVYKAKVENILVVQMESLKQMEDDKS